jgi:hypothetical protein
MLSTQSEIARSISTDTPCTEFSESDGAPKTDMDCAVPEFGQAVPGFGWMVFPLLVSTSIGTASELISSAILIELELDPA